MLVLYFIITIKYLTYINIMFYENSHNTEIKKQIKVTFFTN